MREERRRTGGGGPAPTPLPRIEELPAAKRGGLDHEAVAEAFGR